MQIKNIRKIIIILIALICVLLFSENNVQAETSAALEAGKHIANYAINMAEKHSSEFNYKCEGDYQYCRRQAYYGNKTYGYYTVDCAGFADMVVYQSTGLNLEDYGHSADSSVFAAQNDCWNPPYEQISVSEIQPGDLLCNSHHTMVYVGGGMIVHCDGGGRGVNGGSLSYESIEDYMRYGSSDGVQTAFRIREDIAQTLTQFNDGGDIHSLDGGLWGGIKDAGGKIINAITEFFEPQEDIPVGAKPDNQEFYYKGLAEEKDKRTETVEEDKWIHTSISSALDWVTGTISMVVRAPFIGWGNIIQVGASQYVYNASGDNRSFDLSKGFDDPTEFKKQMDESITVEKLVYNQVPLFDVNVFSNNAKDGKLTSTIKQLVADWYYLIRQLSLIVLLLVLIYIGIKAAVSTIAEDKAKFKKMFVNWLVAFIVVFFLHYLMLLVLKLNESLISIFSSIGTSSNLYYEVRKLTWSMSLAEGIIGTVLYLALVWYLIKFLIIYFKRLFVIVLLIIIGPFVGAKYAYDKLKGAKQGTSLKRWIKEFIFSVVMQSIHALTYTLFVTITVNMAKSGDNMIIARCLIALIFFSFMQNGEKIIRAIFNLTGSKDGSDLRGSIKLGGILGVSYALRNNFKNVFLPMLDVTKYISEKALYVAGLKQSPTKYIEDGYVKLVREELEEKYGVQNQTQGQNSNNQSNITGLENTNKLEIDQQIDEAIRDDLQLKLTTIKETAETTAQTAFGMAQIFLSIPAFVVESPQVGMEWMSIGLMTMMTAAGKPITGYKNLGKYQYKAPGTARLTVETLATFGMNRLVRNLKSVYSQRFDIYEYGNPKRFRMLIEAKNMEIQLRKQLGNVQLKEFARISNPNAVLSELELKLAQKRMKQLLEVINDAQKGFTKEQIKEKIIEFQNEKGEKLNFTHIEELAEKFEVKDDENPFNNISINKDEFKKNVRKEAKTQIAKQVISGNKASVNTHTIDSMKNNLNNKIVQLDKDFKNATTDVERDEITKRRDLTLLATYMIDNQKTIQKGSQQTTTGEGKILTVKELLDQMSNAQTTTITGNMLSKEDNKALQKIISSTITNKTAEKSMDIMSSDEVNELIRNAFSAENSIEKAKVPKKYQDIVESVKQLNEQKQEIKELQAIGIDENGKAEIKEEINIFTRDQLLEMVKNSMDPHNRLGEIKDL